MSIRSTLKPPHLAAAAAFGSGLLVHLFGLVNVLHNYDDIAQQPRGYGTGVTSGRWLLSIMGDFCDAIGGNFNLPTVNGLLFLLLIAVSAGLLVSVFRFRNRASAALMGVLFAVFPSAFSTLAFRYTAVYYGVAILLSVAAVWLFQRCSWGFFLSALCIACSLGIYQAYVPITIGMFVLMLLQESLSDDADFRKLLRRSLACCGVLLLGLLLYYVFLKLTLCLYGTQLSDYQGVSIKAAYLLIGLFSGVLLVFLLIKRVRKPSIRLFSLLLCAVFPVAVNFVVIMCPDSWIYTLMVYSLVLISYVPLILLNQLIEDDRKRLWLGIVKKGVAIMLSVLALCYAYQTNVNYTALYYANRQVENYFSSIVTQVRMADGFTPDMEWALFGDFEDPLLGCYWEYEMTYGGVEFTQWLLNRYSWWDWIHNYYGYAIPTASDEKIRVLAQSDAVRAMPCWPADGSIQVVGDTVVIKCQELP